MGNQVNKAESGDIVGRKNREAVFNRPAEKKRTVSGGSGTSSTSSALSTPRGSLTPLEALDADEHKLKRAQPVLPYNAVMTNCRLGRV